MARLRQSGCAPILGERWNVFWRPENRRVFDDMAPLLDVVSPNLGQARRLTGLEDPRRILTALLDAGTRMVVLRMGETGSLLAGGGGGPGGGPARPAAPAGGVTGGRN